MVARGVPMIGDRKRKNRKRKGKNPKNPKNLKNLKKNKNPKKKKKGTQRFLPKWHPTPRTGVYKVSMWGK
jgi:hypothetical protein